MMMIFGLEYRYNSRQKASYLQKTFNYFNFYGFISE
jgi:hypothetical protein